MMFHLITEGKKDFDESKTQKLDSLISVLQLLITSITLQLCLHDTTVPQKSFWNWDGLSLAMSGVLDALCLNSTWESLYFKHTTTESI